MINSELIRQFKFDPFYKLIGDYDLFLRVKNLGNFTGINRPLVNYYLDKFEDHISVNWSNFFRSSYRIWLKQGLLGKFFLPIGILITFVQKVKNLIH